MSRTLELAIDGMHCEACVRRVSAALQRIPGVLVESVQVGSARLAVDPAKATAEQVIAAVDGIGFSARIKQ